MSGTYPGMSATQANGLLHNGTDCAPEVLYMDGVFNEHAFTAIRHYLAASSQYQSALVKQAPLPQLWHHECFGGARA